MITIHIEQDDAGQVTVAVDGGEPVPVEGAEGACEMVEQALGGAAMDEEADAAAFEQGYSGVRGGPPPAAGPVPAGPVPGMGA